ncbi:MAG TPA: FAD-dependent oxidoreductase [Symbiobacteriaceae bacterium]|nr:FAD-dependent oxidoreductase [Symbiobacteriaceae bacterium]
MQKHVVVVGGGWAGCGAAMSAVKAGAKVTLLERTDALLGTGLVGGIMRNNGRFTATEEMFAMGAGELFDACDRISTHRNIEFPDHKHATLYNVSLIEMEVRRILIEAGVELMFETRITGIQMDGKKIKAVSMKGSAPIYGDVFIDTTGSAGPPGNCTKYGEGCAMCVLRCPTFGGRESLAKLAGVKERQAVDAEGRIGAMSGSCKLAKESLDPKVVEELEKHGKIVIPMPMDKIDKAKLGKKACQQYAGGAFAENAIILDTGHAKLMSPYMKLDTLRAIPGLEKARFVDPYSGSVGNSIRYLAMAPHDLTLKVDEVENLFCGGEKAGPLVGHTEAIITGTLAGANAVRYAYGVELITMPTSLAVGDAINLVTELQHKELGWSKKYTFSGSVYFERMKELGLYTTDLEAIKDRVAKAGTADLFATRIAPEVAESIAD